MNGMHISDEIMKKKDSYRPVIIKDDYKGYSLDQFDLPDDDAKLCESILILQGEIQDRAKSLAHQIWTDWDGRPMVALCVMNGASRFFEILIRELNYINCLSVTKKPFIIKYLKLENYIDDKLIANKSTELPESLKKSLANHHFLAVEDIVDTGTTMVNLLSTVLKLNALSAKVATMVTKRTERSNGYVPDYSCFEIPDHWVVGFGLDYNDHFRHHDHIYILSDEGKIALAESANI